MPMLILVNTAVTVPVNFYPLCDDGDFKSREVAITYNQAGMDLVWNFVTPAGVITQTAVTPTTSGVYDWTHSGDGMYKIEIPASGGGSINNDTAGTGWFTGVCTGVLPWAGPLCQFTAVSTLVDPADVALLLARLGAFSGSGFNTALGFLQAIMRNDVTLPSDIGGTYDDAEHSLEAIVEAQPFIII